MKAALIASLLAFASTVAAKEAVPSEELTLAEAEALAIRQAPQLSGAYFKEEAAKQVVRQYRAGFFPQANGIATLVGDAADLSSSLGQTASPTNAARIGATGGLNNPSVFTRESNGLLLSQLLTDFGRTSHLTSAARFQALSEAQKTLLARMQVVLAVDESYFQTLEAQAVLRVANEVVSARKLLYDQISVLSNNKLKSDLDVSVAKVSLGEGNLLLLQARNNLEKAFANLSQSLGYREPHQFSLKEEPQRPSAGDSLSPLVQQALQLRPDAASLRSQREAAYKLAAAEGAARYPTVTAIGAVGITPFGDSRVTGNYAAGGINVEMPVFDGGRISARIQEASFKAKATQKAVDEAEDQIVRDVSVAWFNAASALKKIEVTKDLVANASEALTLADARYRLGSVSIIELSQAQLGKTQADIDYASARYEYQISRAMLDFETGALSLRIPGKPVR
jgi:outer membrane protein